MSGSILLGDSPTRVKSSKKAKPGKVDRRLNMGSGVLDDDSATTHDVKYVHTWSEICGMNMFFWWPYVFCAELLV